MENKEELNKILSSLGSSYLERWVISAVENWDIMTGEQRKECCNSLIEMIQENPGLMKSETDNLIELFNKENAEKK